MTKPRLQNRGLGPPIFNGVCKCVTSVAKRDQVLFGVVAGVAAKFFVVDFQVHHRATRLTSPAIAKQDLLPISLVRTSSSVDQV